MLNLKAALIAAACMLSAACQSKFSPASGAPSSQSSQSGAGTHSPAAAPQPAPAPSPAPTPAPAPSPGPGPGVSPQPAPTPAPSPSPSASGVTAQTLGLIINDNDPDSVTVGNYYKTKRAIPAANIVHVSLPLQSSITSAQFAPIKAQVDAALPTTVQALAIAWTRPYRVDCNSMTSAFARGFIAGSCTGMPTCYLSTPNPFYNSNSRQPFADFSIRPAMMLAGLTVADAEAMIDRGVASDHTNPSGYAHIMKTTDAARNVRAVAYPTANLGNALSPKIFAQVDVANTLQNTTNTLFYFQGLASVPDINTNSFPPGTVADHLTSYGGQLTDSSQMTCLKFIAGGATGTFGTVVEPCNYLAKFPDPSLMIKFYTGGETLVEAYWKSVQQTFQGIFVGEPLAQPWAP